SGPVHHAGRSSSSSRNGQLRSTGGSAYAGRSRESRPFIPRLVRVYSHRHSRRSSQSQTRNHRANTSSPNHHAPHSSDASSTRVSPGTPSSWAPPPTTRYPFAHVHLPSTRLSISSTASASSNRSTDEYTGTVQSHRTRPLTSMPSANWPENGCSGRSSTH